MNGKANKILMRFLASVVTICLIVGCNSANSTGVSDCSTNEALAVIKSDGNVYLYDLCEARLTQLTFDGQTDVNPENKRNDNYYFFDSYEAWAPDGNMLLVGKGLTAYVLNLQNNTITPIGDRVISASWSPNGSRAVLTQIPKQQPSLFSDPLDYNLISVISIESFSEEVSFEGNAPAWISETNLVYFTVTEKQVGQYYLHEAINLSVEENHRETLNPEVKTIMAPLRYTRLSADKQYAAVYSYEPRNLTLLSLNVSEIFTAQWYVKLGVFPTSYTSNAYRWAPIKSMLAVCTQQSGLESPPSDSAVFILAEFDEQQKVIGEQHCAGYLSSTNVGWNPSGDIAVFLNDNHHLGFVDVASGKLIEGFTQPDEFDIEGGPWWSSGGSLIGVIANNGQICVASVDGISSSLEFTCLVEGSEMAWRP